MQDFIYDFDGQFQKYLNAYIKKHAAEYATQDKLEDALVGIYEDWLDMPAKWLDGVRPREYFAGIDSADTLVGMLEKYLNAGVAVPNVLLDAISDRGLEAEDALVRIVRGEFRFAKNDEARQNAFVHAVDLLNEAGSVKPVDDYIAFIMKHGKSEDCEKVAEALCGIGGGCTQKVLSVLGDGADEDSASWLLSVLVETGNDAGIYEALLRAFRTDTQRRALYASYLGKYGEADAIDDICEVMKNEELNYLEWIECKNAVEALGGNITFDMPDFTGDEYYESMKNL